MCPTYFGPGAEMRHAPLARYKGGHAPRARYYMPEIGRFIQSDPIKFRSGDANWYAYVENGPILAIDPLGERLFINNYSGATLDISPYSVITFVEQQIRNNSQLSNFFNSMLSGGCHNGEEETTIEDILSGELHFWIGIYDSPFGFGDGQVRWDGVFWKAYPEQPNKTIGLDKSLFMFSWLGTDTADKKAAASIIIHELAHIAEAYGYGKVWPGLQSTGNTDTGYYAQSLIRW